VGHLSKGSRFHELRRQFEGMDGLGWQTTVLRCQCAVAVILEDVRRILGIFSWHDCQNGKIREMGHPEYLCRRLLPTLHDANLGPRLCILSFGIIKQM
jgi:hypothetical protein